MSRPQIHRAPTPISTPFSAPFAAPASVDEQRWRQVLSRANDDSKSFVYAVTTTGIFCRPTCPSRRPTRKNVKFFDTPTQARAHNFRPCLRCNPEGPATQTQQADLIQRLCAHLNQNLESQIHLSDLAQIAGLSPSHTQRLFHSIMGVTPHAYRTHRRMETLTQTLTNASNTVTEALYTAGFSSSSRLYERSTSTLGMRPGDLRRGGKNITITFTTTQSPLGRMLLATTALGVCAIAFADTDTALEADLRTRYPNAILQPDTNGTLAETIASVLQRITEPAITRALPLDLRATAFQLRVWAALTQIPRGQTRTYTQIAQAIGSPAAVRAVARACASNPVAVAVPCHRVIGSNGKLTGYRWGVERKRQLLQLEQTNTSIAPDDQPRSDIFKAVP